MTDRTGTSQSGNTKIDGGIIFAIESAKKNNSCHAIIEECKEIAKCHEVYFYPATGWEKTLVAKGFSKMRLSFDYTAFNLRIITKLLRHSIRTLVSIKGNRISRVTLTVAKRLGVHTVCFSNDNYRFRHNRNILASRVYKYFDKVVTCKPLDLPYLERCTRGKSSIVLGMHGYSDIEHFIDLDRAYSSIEVAFIGTYEKRRDEILSKIVKSGYRVMVRGDFWCGSEFERTSRVYQPEYADVDRTQSPAEYRKIISNAAVVINFFRKRNEDTINSRLIEILACGGICICEDTKEARQVVDNKEIIDYFNTEEDLMVHLRRLTMLSDEERARRRRDVRWYIEEKRYSHGELWSRYIQEK